MTQDPIQEPTKSTRPGSLLVIFLTVFIDLLGFGMVLPLLPIYADQFSTDPSGFELGMLMACFSIMQFFFAPIWGSLSDKVGRRPILIFGLIASVLFYTLFGFATIWRSLPWLFVSRISAGIAGATIPTAQAYIADTTTPEKRARGMALIGVAFGAGFTFGPLFGYLAVPDGNSDPGPMPGYAAAGLSAIAAILAIFLLPESKTKDSKSAARKIFDVQTFKTAMSTPVVLMILATIFMVIFSFAKFETTLSMLIKGSKDFSDSPFKLTFKQICLTYAFIGFTLIIIQGGFVRRISLKVSERPLATFGAICMVIGLLVVVAAIAQSSLTILFVELLVIVTGYSCLQPTLNSLLSRRSDPEKQGAIMGLGQSVNALARIFGSALGIPLIKFQILSPYLIGAAIMSAGAVLVWFAGKPVPSEAENGDESLESGSN